MAIISDPFVAIGPKQLADKELIQALRADIVGEYEAIIGYEAHATAASDQRVKQTLYKIADQERQHVGQLLELLFMLNPQEAQSIEQGRQNFRQQQLQSTIQPSQQQGQNRLQQNQNPQNTSQNQPLQ